MDAAGITKNIWANVGRWSRFVGQLDTLGEKAEATGAKIMNEQSSKIVAGYTAANADFASAAATGTKFGPRSLAIARGLGHAALRTPMSVVRGTFGAAAGVLGMAGLLAGRLSAMVLTAAIAVPAAAVSVALEIPHQAYRLGRFVVKGNEAPAAAAAAVEGPATLATAAEAPAAEAPAVAAPAVAAPAQPRMRSAQMAYVARQVVATRDRGGLE